MSKVLKCDLCKRTYPEVDIDHKVKFKEKEWSRFWDNYVWKKFHICKDCIKAIRKLSKEGVEE